MLLHPWIPARFNGTPMGLLYLATISQISGHTVKVIDLQAMGRDFDLNSALAEFKPSVIGVFRPARLTRLLWTSYPQLNDSHPKS